MVLVGGGGVFAVNLLSGGGTQPHDVLPGDAMAYVRLDLNPAANQKVALFNIARKFTVTKDSFSSDDDDPRTAIFDLITKDNQSFGKIDYAADVQPWLGDRIGLAVLAPAKGTSTPGFVVAVQVTDEAAAKTGIAKLMGDDKYGIAFREDYALLTASPGGGRQGRQRRTPGRQRQLLRRPGRPRRDRRALLLGGRGQDRDARARTGQPERTTERTRRLEQIKNARVAGALRFDGDYVELAGISRGVPGHGTGRLPSPPGPARFRPPPPVRSRSPASAKWSASSGRRS